MSMKDLGHLSKGTSSILWGEVMLKFHKDKFISSRHLTVQPNCLSIFLPIHLWHFFLDIEFSG